MIDILQKQEIAELIKKSARVLIVLPENADGDAIGAGLACSLALQRLKKNVDLVCSQGQLPEKYRFLPKGASIQGVLPNYRQILITVDMEQNVLEDFSYEVHDHLLSIFITPKDAIREESISIAPPRQKHDLIIVIGAERLEQLGSPYQENETAFRDMPIINVHYKKPDTPWGTIQTLLPEAISLCEVLYSLLTSLNPKLIDPDVSTCLLFGIIMKTHAFRSRPITANILSVAASVTEQGGRREEIIKHLYYNKEVSTLKLWGHLLMQLKTDLNERIAWTTATKNDFTSTNSSAKNLPDIFDELLSTLTEVEIAAIFFESSNQDIGVYVHTFIPLDLHTLFKEYHPKNTYEGMILEFPKTPLNVVEREVISAIKKHLEEKNT